MQYEKAYAELIVFGGGDVIVTSPGGIIFGSRDSSEEPVDKNLHRPGGRHDFPGRPRH